MREVELQRETQKLLESGSLFLKGGSNYAITNKASVNVKANQATAKARLNDTFPNQTTQWIKKDLLGA